MNNNNFTEALTELKTAKSVDQWNEIRYRWVDILGREELAEIDSSGLIVQVLGRDVDASLN
jgi:hypothetical protein